MYNTCADLTTYSDYKSTRKAREYLRGRNPLRGRQTLRRRDPLRGRQTLRGRDPLWRGQAWSGRILRRRFVASLLRGRGIAARRGLGIALSRCRIALILRGITLRGWSITSLRGWSIALRRWCIALRWRSIASLRGWRIALRRRKRWSLK